MTMGLPHSILRTRATEKQQPKRSSSSQVSSFNSTKLSLFFAARTVENASNQNLDLEATYPLALAFLVKRNEQPETSLIRQTS